MSLRMPIPKKMREQLAQDPYMKQCAMRDKLVGECEGRVEWNHAFQYAGKRQNELYFLIPMCHLHHTRTDYRYIRPLVNEEIRTRIAHFKAEGDFREKYPRSQLLIRGTN